MYITMDASGFQDLRLRFDIEGTPGDLPESYDVFYRFGGAGNWYRKSDQNNIPLNFLEYDPVDPDNQYADSGQISLASELAGQAQVEIIISDFAENGNNEMEIDNLEIVGTAIPEASSVAFLALAGLTFSRRRR